MKICELHVIGHFLQDKDAIKFEAINLLMSDYENLWPPFVADIKSHFGGISFVNANKSTICQAQQFACSF